MAYEVGNVRGLAWLPHLVILYVYFAPYLVPNLEHYQGYSELTEIIGFLKSLLAVTRS